MVLLTVFALYGSDFNDYFGNSSTDLTMDILVTIAMVVFFVELVLLSKVRAVCLRLRLCSMLSACLSVWQVVEGEGGEARVVPSLPLPHATPRA